MAPTRAALVLVAAGAVALVLVSGGSSSDPRTPAALPGLAIPFLGTAVVGSGGLTAAIDAYGDVVDLRAPGPAGRALIDNSAARQAAGSVPAETGIVPRVRVESRAVGGRAGAHEAALPLWRADSVRQRYLPGTNVVRTEARLGRIRVTISDAAFGQALARVLRISAPPGVRLDPSFGVDLAAGASCRRERASGRVALVCGAGAPGAAGAGEIVERAIMGDRRWLSAAEPLGTGAPAWARRMYGRSLLVLRALTDRRTGAVAAGARDGWAYVWPRDAGTAALAFAAAGYRAEARRVARFLLGLDLSAAARFHGDGTPVAGRGAQGDAYGWAVVAARAAGLPPPSQALPWRNRADYQEGDPGTYLANVIASTLPVDGPQIRLYGGKSAHQRAAAEIRGGFGVAAGLVRRSGDPSSGLDSAAAWAVRPFTQPTLFPAVRATLLRLAGGGTRFGITPGAAWRGVDPWTAPTAWSAWSLAALAKPGGAGYTPASPLARRGTTKSPPALRDRHAALRLLAALRRAATPAGALPERVDASTGVPVSTTPLIWSHAFTILALHELWP